MQRDPARRTSSSLAGERGTTHIELIVILGILAVVSGMAIPSFSNALGRNKVFTSSELVASAIRNARLAAITRNAPYRVRFQCPAAGGVRVLAVTGDATIDDDVDRCSTTLADDGPSMFLPNGVGYGTVPTLDVNGRGQMSVPAAAMPLNITVTYEGFSRTLSISGTGRVTTPSS